VESESRESQHALEAEQLRTRVTELELQCTPPRTAATPRHHSHHSQEVHSPLRLPLLPPPPPSPSPSLSPPAAAAAAARPAGPQQQQQKRAEERLQVAQRTLHSAVSQLHSLADSVAAPSAPCSSSAATQVG